MSDILHICITAVNINKNSATVREKHRYVNHHLKEFVTQKDSKLSEKLV